MGLRNTFIAIVAVVAIGTGAWLSYLIATPPAETKTATVLPAGNPLAEFSLLDHEARIVSRDVFSGQWDLVFFGFTHCPDICPTTMQVLASVKRQLADAGQEPLPRIVLVSVDPERDTPDIMRQYVSYFADDILGITGDLEEIRKLTGSLGVYFEKTAPEGDNYQVQHWAGVLVINPRGELQALFGGYPHKAEDLVHDLPIIMANR